MAWDTESSKDPFIVDLGGNQRVMLYSGRPGTGGTDYFQLGKAISSDGGVTWAKDGGNPVVTVGGGSSPDEHGASFPVIVPVGDTWHLFYTGTDSSGLASICYATSTDYGSSWSKVGITIAPGAVYDLCGAISGDVLYDGTTWHMFYAGRPSNTIPEGFKICYASATSPSGPWTKSGVVLSPVASTTLTASVTSGDITLTLGSTSGLVTGHRIGISDGTLAADSVTWHRVKSIDSSTQVTLTAPCFVAYASGKVVAASDGVSLFPRSLVQFSDGTYRLYCVGFQQWWNGSSWAPFNERTIAADAANLSGPWSINHDVGFITPRRDSWSGMSAENFVLSRPIILTSKLG